MSNEEIRVNPPCLEGLLSLKEAGLTATSHEVDNVSSAWNADQIVFDEAGRVISLNLGNKRLRKGMPVKFNFASLTTINLGGTDLPIEDTIHILTGVASTIEQVYLGGNMLNNQGATQIGMWLSTRRPQNLVHLDLRFNEIGPEGTHGLCQGLEINPTVIRLYLEGNKLGDAGAAIVANLLRVASCPLVHLFLGANQIGPDGATHLASALSTNKTLTKLYLEGNTIGEDGADAFANVLIHCDGDTGLKHLFCDNNDIGKEGSQRLAKALNSATAIGDSL